MPKIIISLFCLTLLIFSCSEEPCEKKNCKDFKYQKDAQEAFDANPECYKNLDKDNDGVACENLP